MRRADYMRGRLLSLVHGSASGAAAVVMLYRGVPWPVVAGGAAVALLGLIVLYRGDYEEWRAYGGHHDDSGR